MIRRWPMYNDAPDIINEVGFDFHWDNKKVWALDVPVAEITVADLAWHFDLPFHRHKGKLYNLRPRDTMANPQKYKDEYERTLRADLSHPIDVMDNGKGRLVILDGLHEQNETKLTKTRCLWYCPMFLRAYNVTTSVSILTT